MALDASGFQAGINNINQSLAGTQASLSRFVNQTASVFNRATSAFARYEVAQISVRDAQERLTRAQEHYTAATAEFGTGSQQATKALHDIQSAQEDLEKTQRRANIQVIGVATSFVQMATQLPRLASGLAALRASMLATAGASATLSIALTGGLAAIGIVAGLAATSGLFGKTGKSALESAARIEQLNYQLGEAQKKYSEIAELADRPEAILAPSRLFDPEFIRHSRHKLDEKKKAAAEEVRIVQEQIQQELAAQRSAAEAYAHSQLIKLAAVTGNETAIRTEYDATITKLGELDEALRKPLGNEARSQLETQQKALEGYRDSLNATLESISSKAEQMQRGIAQGVASGFGSLGVSIQDFSTKFQENLLRSAGVSDQFIASLRPVVDVEKLLKEASGDTGKALRAQAEITAHKDETTEAFTARLRELGFTEQEIAERVDETGRALKRQADATEDATRATSSDSLTALASTYQSEFLKNLGYKSGNTGGMAFDLEGVINALRSNENGVGKVGVGAYVGDVGSAQRQKAIDALKSIILGHAGSNNWDTFLRAIGITNVPAFANGFDGIVNGDTLFRAGERGPERLTVTPLTGGAAGGGGTTIHIGQIVVNAKDGRDAGEQIARRLRRLGVSGLG